MKKYHIPTAGYEVFDNSKRHWIISKNNVYPIVVKGQWFGIAKVSSLQRNQEAEDTVHSIMQNKVFGASGNQIVVEEFITGPEVSVLAFTDGKTLKPMVSSKDHKAGLGS